MSSHFNFGLAFLDCHYAVTVIKHLNYVSAWATAI